jgi:ParB/RepB/Spo0J family partition protein
MDAGAERTPTRATISVVASPAEQSARARARLLLVSAFKLRPHTLQPAERHSDLNVADLMESIAALGLQDPPVVRRLPNGSHEILAGHRRIRAWQLLALDGRVLEKMRAFVLDGISDREAVYIIAAEYAHRREFSVLHTARIVGAAWNERRAELGKEPTVRDLADILPWGKSSIDDYLLIHDALQDPASSELVHRMDNAKGLLVKILRQDDGVRLAALHAYAESGPAGARRVLSSTVAAAVVPTVERKDCDDGYDLLVRVRRDMSAEQIEAARVAMAALAQDLSGVPR